VLRHSLIYAIDDAAFDCRGRRDVQRTIASIGLLHQIVECRLIDNGEGLVVGHHPVDENTLPSTIVEGQLQQSQMRKDRGCCI
jgi:hypothetical protein